MNAWARSLDVEAMMKKIRVLCVDDSALVRGLMTEIINSHDDMEVVAVAPVLLVACELFKQHTPDVLTLELKMPRMDELDFLEKLMRRGWEEHMFELKSLMLTSYAVFCLKKK